MNTTRKIVLGVIALASFVNIAVGVVLSLSALVGVAASTGLWVIDRFWRFAEEGSNDGYHALTDPPTIEEPKSRTGKMHKELTATYRRVFKDESIVTVRPKSQFKVEEFLFDQNSKKATLNLTKGGLRIITGKISKNQPENYRLKTPVASMGVRGTRFDARLCETDCASEERLITHSE